MKKLILIVTLSINSLYSQTPLDYNLGYKVGDTLEIKGNKHSYLGVYSGRGLSIKILENLEEDTKCEITKFNRLNTSEFAICKNRKKTFTVNILVATEYDELILPESKKEKIDSIKNPPRVNPPEYESFVFQGLKWKDNKRDIKSKIKGLEESENMMTKETVIANLDATLVFGTVKDQLSYIGYLFNEEHTNKNLFIKDFEKVKSILTKKYGEPTGDFINWNNDLYKDNPQDYGTSVAVGYTEYTAYWKLSDTDIILKLKGDNFKINMLVKYASFPALVEENKDDLDKF